MHSMSAVSGLFVPCTSFYFGILTSIVLPTVALGVCNYGNNNRMIFDLKPIAVKIVHTE